MAQYTYVLFPVVLDPSDMALSSPLTATECDSAPLSTEETNFRIKVKITLLLLSLLLLSVLLLLLLWLLLLLLLLLFLLLMLVLLLLLSLLLQDDDIRVKTLSSLLKINRFLDIKFCFLIWNKFVVET